MEHNVTKEKQCKEIQDYFSAHDIELSYRNVIFYANVFETIGKFTNNKLDTDTIIHTFTFILRILEHCPNQGRISCIMTLMDFECFPAELNKLNQEEKEKFAFCIEGVLFINVLNEVSGDVQKEIRLFTDVKKMERVYSFFKKKTPEWFTEKSPWSKEELYRRARKSLTLGK